MESSAFCSRTTTSRFFGIVGNQADYVVILMNDTGLIISSDTNGLRFLVLHLLALPGELFIKTAT